MQLAAQPLLLLILYRMRWLSGARPAQNYSAGIIHITTIIITTAINAGRIVLIIVVTKLMLKKKDYYSILQMSSVDQHQRSPCSANELDTRHTVDRQYPAAMTNGIRTVLAIAAIIANY